MSIKQYKKHADVPKKYKWDLTTLLENKKPEEALKSIVNQYKKMIPIKDSKYNSAANYLKYLNANEKLNNKSFKFYNYVSNLLNLNVSDASAQALSQKFEYEMYKVSNAIGPEDARFFKHAKNLKKWASLPEFKEYKYAIEHKLEEKKYALPQVIQEYNLKISRGTPNLTEIFNLITDSEIDYGFATSKTGKKTKITRANHMKLKESSDQSIRKTTYDNFWKGYLKNKGSLSSAIFQHKKQESAYLLSKGFTSSVQGLIFSDRVGTAFLEKLYASVQNNRHIFKPYVNANKKFYKLAFNEKMNLKYDSARPLIKVNASVTPEKAIQDVKSALKPFGEEYTKIVKSALDNDRWVDFMPIDNKMSGAYSIGMTYNVDQKLILMNFAGDIRSTETLAHEMGHSMHSYYSDKVQKNSTNSAYPIFLAEIASIFNELMLHDYWLKTLKSDKLKFKILKQQIDGFVGTVLRQAEWSNFEYDLYNRIDKGEPLGSFDALAKLYYDNSKKYAILPKKKFVANEQVGPIYVPHFYYGFYVYKYAIGQLVANIFFAKYKKEGPKALKFYIDKFLSAGGSKNPLDILKDAGIDLNDENTYQIGFSSVQKNIKEYIRLGNKIFKK